jgi:hypothetical protein
MPFDLTNFTGELIGSGARPNLFQIELTFPPAATDGEAGRLLPFMAEAATLPGDHLGTISVFYFGRELKYPGDRRFQPWAFRIINDENFKIRKAFQKWMNALNMHVANLRSPIAGVPSGYKVNATIKQYAKVGGDPIHEYKLVNCWPSEVTPIEVSWESADTLEKFDVTIQYDWWTDVTTT